MNGVLLVNKPTGWTSFDVVNKVRRIVGKSPLNTSNKKRFPVGHTGTLDPLATGLLVLLLGTYTKRAPELTKLDKTYKVTMRLGQVSTTGDEEGEKTVVSDMRPADADVSAALQHFKGERMQIPPAYSAVKVNGQRAYKLARAGQTPELAARPITIYDIVLKKYEYPFVAFTVAVSSGTYVRTLVEEVGAQLQTGAYMNGLCRTTVGPYSLDKALDIENITPENVQKALLS